MQVILTEEEYVLKVNPFIYCNDKNYYCDDCPLGICHLNICNDNITKYSK
jgi:hypothetical protein